VRRGRAVVGVALALAMLVSACGDDGDDTQASPTSGGTTATSASTGSSTATSTATGGSSDTCTADKAGGELKYAAFLMTRSFDPTVSTGSGTTGAIELVQVYDSLIRWNPDTRKFEPWLAQSLEPNADYTVWTLKLRPNVTFGSGDPVDAAAVKASIARHMDVNNRSTMLIDLLSVMQSPDAIQVVDPLTLEFHLTVPWGTFPFILSDMAGMVTDTKVIDQLGKDQFGLMPTGAGAGPYEVTKFVPGESIELTAKDDYWGGPVCIKKVTITDVPGDAATLDALKLGEVDAAFFRSPKVNAEVRQESDLQNYFEVNDVGAFLMIYSGDPARPTANVNLRRAMALAMDPKLMNQRTAGGVGLPTDRIIWDESPISPGVPGVGYDPEQAKQLVAAEKAKGFDGKIDVLCSSLDPDPGVAIKGLLEAVGFQVNLELVDPNQSTPRIYIEQNYQIACSGTSMQDASPVVSLNRWWGPTNRYTGFRDDEFNADLAQLRAAFTEDETKAALAKLQQRWNEVMPAVVYAAAEQGVAWNPKLKGLVFNHDAVFSLAKAYLEQ
jgi:peptide/nickel transport system substrate-binding protein